MRASDWRRLLRSSRLGALAAPGKVDVVAFGLWGDQSVFASEAEGAARAIARQFGPVDKIVVRANTKRSGEATEDNLRLTLAALGGKMDPDRDLLFLILTSHGDPEGVGVQTPPDQTSLITPIELRTMLRESGARLSVVIVSACYSGVFADALAETRYAGHHRRRRRPRLVRLPRRSEMDELRRGLLRRSADPDEIAAGRFRLGARTGRRTGTRGRFRSLQSADGGR